VRALQSNLPLLEREPERKRLESLVGTAEPVTFFAAGGAQPKGSTRALLIGGHARIAPASNKERGWRALVGAAGQEAVRAAGVTPLEGCVEALFEFYSARPMSHLRADGTVKPGRPPRPPTAPDADKLARSVGDALNGVCWRDDAQLVELTVRKLYTCHAQPYAGVRVTVRPFVGA
jgi:Holliday junction resolvase RusA-like endonuclease